MIRGALLRGRHLVTTAAVLFERGRIFLAQRGAGGSEAFRWELPGGKCDQDVNETDCLRRELHEELSVQVAVGAELGNTAFTAGGRRLVLVAYRARVIDGWPRLGVHVACGWFTLDEARSLDLSQSDRAILTALNPRALAVGPA